MRIKKAHGLWDGFGRFEQIVRCFYKAARGKFTRAAILEFYSNLENNCLQISSELKSGEYQWGTYRSFYVEDPKRRLIESAPFRDRIVHHAIFEVLEPVFDPCFYAHSYACRKGRGTHRAMYALHRWIANEPDLYFLQMDVSKYFPSINRDILSGLIHRKVGDTRFLALIDSLLKNSPGLTGIPIGNLTSQLFANLYLNPLDQFIKRKLRAVHYVRYMDDIVILDPSLEHLARLKEQIQDFAMNRLLLKFHPHKVSLGAVHDGITFVGYRIFPSSIALRGKSLRRFRKRLREPLPLDKKVRRLLSYCAHALHATQNNDALMKDFCYHAYHREPFLKHYLDGSRE